MSKPKISQKLEREIRATIAQLDKGIAFIMSDATRIVRVHKRITALPESHWRNGTGQEGYAMTKEIGSELCYIFNARESLVRLITPVIVETETLA